MQRAESVGGVSNGAAYVRGRLARLLFQENRAVDALIHYAVAGPQRDRMVADNRIVAQLEAMLAAAPASALPRFYAVPVALPIAGECPADAAPCRDAAAAVNGDFDTIAAIETDAPTPMGVRLLCDGAAQPTIELSPGRYVAFARSDDAACSAVVFGQRDEVAMLRVYTWLPHSAGDQPSLTVAK